MLLWFVIAYWVVSVAIGLWAATRVHNTKDFAIAGRHLPFYMVTATVFATWFGSETVLGIPATFLEEGLRGVVADPFGSSMCLILVGLFFAAPLYRMNLLTIGDFYKRRYGRGVEVLTTIAIVISYLGWVGAQITALGLVFNVVSAGEISKIAGMWIGSITILVYTFFGGMWAVAVTDFVQMIVIVIGMLYIGAEVSGMVGGVGVVADHALQAGKLEFFPAPDPKDVIAFIAAWVTMMFGSIPQQDVFQRVQSSRTERIAVWGSVLGGCLYFLFAFVPMYLAYSATLIDPKLVSELMESDSQLILPSLILDKAPLFAQVMFFGALLSAIKSCASATLLAPSVSFTENILRPMMGTHDRPQAAHHDAHRDAGLHPARHPVRDQLEGEHLPHGRKRLSGHAGKRIHPARLRHLLEAIDQPGRALLRSLRRRGLARGPLLRVGRSIRSGAARGAHRERRRHDRGLPRTAVPAPRSAHSPRAALRPPCAPGRHPRSRPRGHRPHPSSRRRSWRSRQALTEAARRRPSAADYGVRSRTLGK